MNIKTMMTTTLGILFGAMQICADTAQTGMPLVTRIHKGGLHFLMGMPIPYWLNHWGVLGIFIALIIATIIESNIISRFIGIAYKKTIYPVFLANIITGIMQWILGICFAKIHWNYLLSLFLNMTPEQIEESSWQLISINATMLTLLLFLLTIFCIKLIIQYFIIRHYHANANRTMLKKSIIYATIASYASLCILEIILYHLVEIKTTTYPLVEKQEIL